nr:putative ribonuclease H-like domain-containing protein [Tanacetum cinerariifolium]
MPPKHDLRLIDEHFESVSVDVISNIAPSDVKTVKTIDVYHKSVFNTEEPKPVIKKNFSPPIIEDWHSDDESEEEISPIIKVKFVKPSLEKIKYVKPAREIVKTEESPKQHKHHPRGSQHNWNNLMSQRLGSNFKMINKACYVCGSFEHLQRLGHINFETMNKLVKGNLVRGLPSKIFQNDNSCVACQKGKKHKASYKAKLVNTISKPLHMLHMYLFGPTNVKSLMKKSYCLVVTDDFSRFSWVFYLDTKGETSEILKTFITGIENQLDCKVKVIRCDTGTEFKNSVMNQFCEDKRIKKKFNVARTPQQNRVAERRNKTLIEAATTMLVDSKLLTTF